MLYDFDQWLARTLSRFGLDRLSALLLLGALALILCLLAFGLNVV